MAGAGTKQICVLFHRPEQARTACRSLENSLLFRSAKHLSIHHRGGLTSAGVARARARAGAAFGAILTSLAGAGVAFGIISWADLSLAPTVAVLWGAAGGLAYGLGLGAVIGGTEATPSDQQVVNALGQGCSALVVEFDDPMDAATARRLLLRCQGAVDIAGGRSGP